MNLLEIKYSMILPGKIFLLVILVFLLSACEKLVAVDELPDRLLAEQVFENDATANSAIAGIYKTFKNSLPNMISLRNPTYSDEIIPYTNTLSNTYYTNRLIPNDNTLPWANLYQVIYGANNAIEGLATSKNITDNTKKRLTAEAKFMRAMCHFYLMNIFGEIPLVLTTDVETNRSIPRSSYAAIYSQIITDLKDAKLDLGEDYSHAANERVRTNKWVAAAMLARVYLFQKDYVNAETEANAVIGSGKYSLLTSPTGIWNKNNNEAILQLANNNTESNTLASSFIYTSAPANIISPALLSAFETGDLRKTTWIRTQTYLGQHVSIPYKLTNTAVNPPEYYTLIRMAEMYLIRAEARVMRDDFQGCIDDVNLIRLRHGALSTPLAAPADRTAAQTVVLHERQVEFFTEACHRFFDLKRTGRLDAVMLAAKPSTWISTAVLYPIPLTETQRNTSLKQNLGYEE